MVLQGWRTRRRVDEDILMLYSKSEERKWRL